MNIIPLQFFDSTGNMPDKTTKAVVKKVDEDVRLPLLCVICRRFITSETERIEMQGSHFHTCTNPIGIVFDIRCFKVAPGCMQIGSASAEHTWFNGYRWQITLCKDCGEHLGWLFKGSGSFYGLIATRLTNK